MITTGILAMLTAFASLTGTTVSDNFVQKNNIVIQKTIKRMNNLSGTCIVKGPVGSDNKRMIALGITCKQGNYTYLGRLILDVKTQGFIRVRDKVTIYMNNKNLNEK